MRVAAIGRTQVYLVGKPQLEATNATEIVVLAKARPDTLSYASAGTGTPPEIVTRLDDAVAKAMAQASVRSRYAELGAEPVHVGTAEFRKLLADEGALLEKVIREQKIVVERTQRPLAKGATDFQ